MKAYAKLLGLGCVPSYVWQPVTLPMQHCLKASAGADSALKCVARQGQIKRISRALNEATSGREVHQVDCYQVCSGMQTAKSITPEFLHALRKLHHHSIEMSFLVDRKSVAWHTTENDK